jgi:chitin synthase
VWHVLFFHAVRRRHGVGWNTRFTGRDFFHPVPDHRFHHSRRNEYDHPARFARHHFGSSRFVDCHHDKEIFLRRLDVDLPPLTPGLERHLAHLRVLALRRLLVGSDPNAQGETAGTRIMVTRRGEFDSSGIVMKRWVEFERERRWKSGTPSARNSYYDPRSSSPKRYVTCLPPAISDTNDRNADSRRQSLVSTTERDSRGYDATTVESSNYTQGSGSRSRHDSQQLLMLPAPLSVNRPSPSPMSGSRLSRTSEDAGGQDSSRQRLISSPQSTDDRYGYDTPEHSPSMPSSLQVYLSNIHRVNNHGALRPTRNAGETNPFVHPNSQRMTQEYDRSPFSTEPEEYPGNYTPSPSSQSQAHRNKGFSLMDTGPVPGPDGVRRVARKRQSQQGPPQNRYSRGSTYLPPGAAMPQPGCGNAR